MSGLYIHVPFCKQACHYCDFYFVTQASDHALFVKAILQEADMRKDFLPAAPLSSIYIGGGTPSRLSPELIGNMLQELISLFGIQPGAEITLEANPDDLTQQYLRELKKLSPVNRFSMGVQSFQEEDLRWMHRAHNAQQALQIIPLLREEGFENFSIDLIYGTPTLSDENWKKNLQLIATHSVPHFSAYSLTLEPGTALEKLVKTGRKTAPEEERSATHFMMLMDFARDHGYLHYEISNLAIPGHEAIHNSNYWKGAPYLGLGPAAHSFNGQTRTMNIRNLKVYQESILDTGQLPLEVETLSTRDLFNEQIMTGLRRSVGLDLEAFRQQFGVNPVSALLGSAQKWMDKGLLTQEHNRLFLSREGKFLADGIAADLFWV